MMRLGREAIATRGELKTIDLAVQGLVSNIARLEAELANAEEIELPTSLMKRRIIDDAVDRIVKRELLVFDMRKKAFETQLDALSQLQSFLEQEIVSMKKRLELHNIQVDTVQQELDSIVHLFKKGLASAPRKLALERALAQVRGDGLRLESILMQARQEISKTKITIVDLQAKRTRDISAELRNAQAKLEELKSHTNSSKQLLFETEVTAPQIFAAQENRQMKPIFKVLRQSGSVNTEFVADETTVVEPGDTIKVELPLSDVSVPSLGIGFGATDGTRIRHSAREGLKSFPIE
jgi:polysaccharide export outer membrane protein/exopolysaccharide production protein ExoF